jgi:hypothetical protein
VERRDCTGRFEADADACPKCSRRIVGEIADASERLAVEESWEAERTRIRTAPRRRIPNPTTDPAE